MTASMPLYYAGVASDDDELEAMLRKDKKLEHGSSSTIDLQRILGVSYAQIPLSRVKKMTAAVITVVAIILFISLSFHSATTSNSSKHHAVSQDASETTQSTTPTGENSTSMNNERVNKPKSSVDQTPMKTSQNQKKSTIDVTSSTHTRTPTRPHAKRPTLNPHTRHHIKYTNIIPLTLPTPTQPLSEYVLAMNPSISANLDLDCRSCAVVTNSADLRGSNAGSVIDSNDCVIRLNTAPTAGYELDVGEKTTVRVVSQRHIGDLLHYIWHEPDEIRSLSYVITFGLKNRLCKNCTFFKMFKKVTGEYLGEKFIRLTKPLESGRKKETKTRQRFGPTLLSTQFHAINIMRKVCTRMKVFGVEGTHPCLSDRSYRKSYWQTDEYVECDGSRDIILRDIDRYRLEKSIYDQWSTEYDLEFLYP